MSASDDGPRSLTRDELVGIFCAVARKVSGQELSPERREEFAKSVFDGMSAEHFEAISTATPGEIERIMFDWFQRDAESN